jgi:hypothetical protein
LLTGSGLTLDSNSIYVVTVGAGATQTGNNATTANGSNSSFSMVTTTALGGGGAGGYTTAGASGGSGGGGGGANGSASSYAGGAGTSGQGFAGGTGTQAGVYTAGGGGGSSAVGANSTVSVGGNGGAGTASSISGTSVTYAGGGGGGVYAPSGQTPGSGGAGGGGTGGGTTGAVAGTNGTANLGGGGGGGAGSGGLGGNGGSGVVIISYAGSTQQMAGGTVTITGGNVIHTFTSSGYLTPIKYVNNSLRFRSSNSAYLNRTNSSSVTNNKIFTYSLWVKRGSLGVTSSLLAGDNSTAIHYFGYGNSSVAADTLEFYDGQTAAWKIQTNAVYRDPSAYYHVILSVDTTQATAANRVRIYVNGVECSYATATYPAQNTVPNINVASMPLYIGRRSNVSQWYFDGYLTEVNFVDGQALTPNSFGTFNSYGVWQPITYGGSYGINGFYLPFTNNTNTTTIGYDFSPNGNNWTSSGINVTPYSGTPSNNTSYDSMTDVPTLTSATAANYCVLNPLNPNSGTISNGNLNQLFASASYQTAIGTLAMSSGSWYCEVTCTAIGGTGDGVIGIAATQPSSTFVGNTATSYGWYSKGEKYNNGTGVSYNGSATWTTNDVIGIAFNATSGSLEFYKNGTSQGVAYSGIPAGNYFIGVSSHSSTTYAVNFGQRPFSYTPPTGYVALNTYNM